MAVAKAFIGDLVHYVGKSGAPHMAAVVVADENHGVVDVMGLCPHCTDPAHAAHWQTSKDGWTIPLPTPIFSRVDHAAAHLDRAGTWHWPEHRAEPVQV